MISLIRYLRSIYSFPEAVRDYLEENLTEKKVAKKAYLLKPGQVCASVYFVSEGLLRSFYVKEDRDISTAFMKKGDICITIESFFTQRYSQEGIQAIEDSFVYYISYNALQRLYRESEEFNRIGRVMIEQCYLRSAQRMTAMWMQRSEDRYDWLVNEAPEIVRRVPAKYLASYLGITGAMLRIIKRLKKKKETRSL
ncbi:Crp/Fnr family transcriptional regulator [Puia sp. P3]|uniref:Crp/Fnr family transcriptional regulator n=1 Tax=Puia sp. P3 TaxID=3423952 RepID=UPI003D673626